MDKYTTYRLNYAPINKYDQFEKYTVIEVDERRGLVITNKDITNKPIVCAVLSYYQIEFLYSEKEIFVKKELLVNDKDLYWNILLKANDSGWIKEHIPIFFKENR